ncbi:MAG TPA: ATP-dependent metallopeptidase FtsH/Yme1/Tma family protein [Desulfobacteraceae bacterium]|nr:ATP-dependent metallopeptidase FtsH/Yme1/Tma family protein [Desulfobacteraceae bacterium]HDZ76118.1 ATP-dependent metallopeptidase FtsH/Yme1/Tma family protein [Desulfobacteraceae bacterium]
MKKHYKFSIWYFIIGIWVVLLVQNYLASSFAVKTIPYSQFISYLEQGKIAQVAISANQIQGRLKSETTGGKHQYFKTIRVDPETSQLLDKYHVEYSGTVESTLLRDILSWILPVFIFLGVWFFLMKKMMPQQPGFMAFGKNKAKIYKQEDISITFNDVAGVDEAKVELEEIIEFLKTPEKYTAFGGQMPKGLLLVGPPGTGKTMLAKAVAGESNVPFFGISGSEFVEMFVGLGAARVRDLFEEAKKNSPCIIFIDELDALGKARGIGGAGGNDEREQTLNQLLVEMDGFDSNIGVILMAATNRPEVLDPALLRPGRFDRQVLVDRPDKEGRKKILEVHLRKITRVGELDLDRLAAMTAGMVGADLANLVNEATLLAVRSNQKTVEMAQFEEAVERIVAGLEKKNRVINPKERNVVAYHELGHALVAMSLPGTDPVQKITIIPRGIAALGYTIQLPTEDRFLMNQTELLNKIASLLGGRAAEQTVFNEVSTGAHNDLAKATDIARSMVIEYGMSDKLGQVYLKGEPTAQFLQPGLRKSREYSEETARIIDEEVRKIIDKQYEVALDILKDKQGLLKKAAQVLLQKEKISGSELEEIIASDRQSS